MDFGGESQRRGDRQRYEAWPGGAIRGLDRRRSEPSIVAHGPQAQAVPGGQIACGVPIPGVDDAHDVAGTLLALPGLDDGAGDRADHLVAEGVGLDPEVEDAVA